jgi:quercetin dioxygenase-like cupin family protein
VADDCWNKLKKNMTKYLQIISIFVAIVALWSCKDQSTLPDPLQAGWNNQRVCEVLEDSPKLRVLRCTFPPGVGHERHYHAPHFGYTLAGSRFRMTDTTGTREVNVPTGYSFSNEGIAWHEVLNIGDNTAVFLIIEPK